MNNFYINRLKTFSIAEFPYRVKQMVVNQIESKVHLNKKTPSVNLVATHRILKPSVDGPLLTGHTIGIFGKQVDYENIMPADWHRDIFSNKSFPMSFSKKIDIRKDPELSAKCVWELNRMQFLTAIAIKYRQTNDQSELNQFIKIITSWKEANPYLSGVNWYSNIEVNLRLITWFLSWEILNADELINENKQFKSFVNEHWLPLIYQHCVYSFKNPSKFSSANNHLISEYAGLFIASCKWKFPESADWIIYAQKGLEKEIIIQHSKKGVNKEEAAEYIQFITDFFLLAYIVGENSGRPFSNAYKDQLYQVFSYIDHFLDVKGNFPKYGDEDDGRCFSMGFDESFNNFSSILTSAAIIFKNSTFKKGSNDFDIKNQVLFGEKGRKDYDAVSSVDIVKGSAFYAEEGHFISRKIDNNGEVYLHFDAAPLGFLSIAAHGHADALSFLLNVDGQPVMADPGTYTYHTEPQWRSYFIGTLAHNTIRINKLDQATIAGSTLWLNHYSCKVLSAETNDDHDTIKASHNGYEKYGITHTRELKFDKRKLLITITDTIESKKQNTYLVEMPFHFHPEIGVNKPGEHSFQLINPIGRNVHLQLDNKLNTKIVKGQTEGEIAGWYSKSFLYKEPSDTVIGSLEVSGNIQLQTIITINES